MAQGCQDGAPSISLGVVRCGDMMMYSIFLQQYTKMCIIKVRASITDDSPRTSISREDVPREKSEYLSMSVCDVGYLKKRLSMMQRM